MVVLQSHEHEFEDVFCHDNMPQHEFEEVFCHDSMSQHEFEEVFCHDSMSQHEFMLLEVLLRFSGDNTIGSVSMLLQKITSWITLLILFKMIPCVLVCYVLSEHHANSSAADYYAVCL